MKVWIRALNCCEEEVEALCDELVSLSNLNSVNFNNVVYLHRD
uniref:DYW_deaminase domain-containing protein n=1 Tax=Ascaris lumbricoides TaxID=6252 RepID=A0A0M3HRJ4_ASCLU